MSGMNRIVYDDEDNSPMNFDIGLPYPLRTWDEMIKAWQEEQIDEHTERPGRGENKGGAEHG